MLYPLNMLFKEFKRTNTDIYKRIQTAYEFINESAWDISEFSRNKLNEISENYPIDEDFVRMFTSKSNKQHYSTVFELLVYHSLYNSRFIIEKHPETKNGKRPDFRVTTKENKSIFLECTLSGNTFENEDEKNRKDALLEIIDSLEYFPYWINLEFVDVSKNSISKKKLINFVKQINVLCDKYSDDDLKKIYFEFSDSDWTLNISLFRKSDATIKRSLGMINYGAKIIDKTKSITTSLNDKRASKYQIEEEPYVICVSTNDFSISNDDIAEILFGQYNSEKINTNCSKNSFWIANSSPVNTGVSAIIFFKNFDLYTLENSKIEMWHNPFAINKIPKNIFPFTQYHFDSFSDNLYIKKELDGNNIYSILDIDEIKYQQMIKKS